MIPHSASYFSSIQHLCFSYTFRGRLLVIVQSKHIYTYIGRSSIMLNKQASHQTHFAVCMGTVTAYNQILFFLFTGMWSSSSSSISGAVGSALCFIYIPFRVLLWREGGQSHAWGVLVFAKPIFFFCSGCLIVHMGKWHTNAHICLWRLIPTLAMIDFSIYFIDRLMHTSSFETFIYVFQIG